MVLADRAALLVSTVFGSPSDYSGGIVILTMFVYTLQIYADFAGCMDIVRGSGHCLALRLPGTSISLFSRSPSVNSGEDGI